MVSRRKYPPNSNLCCIFANHDDRYSRLLPLDIQMERLKTKHFDMRYCVTMIGTEAMNILFSVCEVLWHPLRIAF